MTDYDEQYQRMSDEQLLRVLAEPDKYHPDALGVARDEAARRGLSAAPPPAPALADEDYVKPPGWFRRTFTVVELTAEERGYKGETLDEMALAGRELWFNDKIVYLVMAAFSASVVLDLIVQSRWIYLVMSGFEIGLILGLILPLIIPVLCVYGLWKKIPAGFYLTAGYTSLNLIAGIFMLWGILTAWLSDYSDLSHLTANVLYLEAGYAQLLAKIISVVLLFGAAWLLCRREMYRQFDLEGRKLPVVFLIGVGIVIVTQFVWSIVIGFVL